MTIVLNITHGFQARMLLRSTIASELLRRNVRLVVLAPNAQEEYFRRECEDAGISLELTPRRSSRVENYLAGIRQYLLMNPALGETLNYKNEVFKRQSPVRWRIARSGNSVLGRLPSLRRAYMYLEKRCFPGDEFDSILQRYRPDLVITGTPGYDLSDAHLLRAAKRIKIRTATVMLSWDNLTSKGYMNSVPDDLLVWSDLMRDEAVEYHDFPRQNIIVCGAAQFDHYKGQRELLDRRRWCKDHGIPLDATLIMYGTINPAILPHEPDIVSAIVAAMRNGNFRCRPHLWIRIHPQAVRGVYSHNLEVYRRLAGDDVTIEEPPVQSDKLAWDLPESDKCHLASLLAASHVVATTSSTLVIDGACVGTPQVGVFFDGQRVSPEISVDRFRRYTHYAKLLRTGGVASVVSVDEFVSAVDAYAENPNLHADARRELVKQQLGTLDGAAGLRTATALIRLCSANAQQGLSSYRTAAPV
jgi:hypothetical protein